VPSTLSWLSVVVPIALLTTSPFRRLSKFRKFLAWLALSLAIGFPIIWMVTADLLIRALFGQASDMAPYIITFILGLACVGVVSCYRVAVYNKLSHTLTPGALPPRPHPDVRAEERIQWVGTAQHGNLTLYSGGNPFLGAGNTTRAWTIAVELDRKGGTEQEKGADRTAVEIDPYELHGFVRQRLHQMSAQAHPNGIINLTLDEQIVAPGRFNQLHGPFGTGPGLHPLLEHGQLRPWTRLSDATVRALMLNPQAGARHYQRVDINSEGPTVHDRYGNLVVPAEDRGTSMTAFIHLAVEGRMLYTEFIVTMLPPVAKAYRKVDELPVFSPMLLGLAALSVFRLQLARDIVSAPFRLMRMFSQTVRNALQIDDPKMFVTYDYGARVSLREFGSAPGASSPIQDLDIYKYTKLVEERLTSAVLDFIEAKGVDTAAYRRQVNAVSNSYHYDGDFRNSQFGGTGAQFNQGHTPMTGQENQ
jgi:hypothetical protein